uniref:Uncharacterized protein n=1 Tax=Trichogramma kaykai TaxID=54128 RepID=A0ABD2XBD3_9HYME
MNFLMCLARVERKERKGKKRSDKSPRASSSSSSDLCKLYSLSSQNRDGIHIATDFILDYSGNEIITNGILAQGIGLKMQYDPVQLEERYDTLCARTHTRSLAFYIQLWLSGITAASIWHKRTHGQQHVDVFTVCRTVQKLGVHLRDRINNASLTSAQRDRFELS